MSPYCNKKIEATLKPNKEETDNKTIIKTEENVLGEKELTVLKEDKGAPDILDYGLKVLFVGINPGLMSKASGHHYTSLQIIFGSVYQKMVWWIVCIFPSCRFFQGSKADIHAKRGEISTKKNGRLNNKIIFMAGINIFCGKERDQAVKTFVHIHLFFYIIIESVFSNLELSLTCPYTQFVQGM